MKYISIIMLSVFLIGASPQQSLNQLGNPVNSFIRNDYSSTGVLTSAYVEIVASTTNKITSMGIFDSSGQTVKLALGAAASEVDQFLIRPGGEEEVRVNVPAGSRISLRAVSANATTGEISINFFGEQ